MADKPNIINYQTKLCAEIIQPLYDMVWDGLGETPEKNSVREFIGAVEEAPLDSTPYARRNGSWVSQGATAVSWGQIGGILSDQIDLQSALDLKADIMYVDAADAFKADITYVDAADALKADITYVDSENATQDAAAMANSPITIGKYDITGLGTINIQLDPGFEYELLIEGACDTDGRYFIAYLLNAVGGVLSALYISNAVGYGGTSASTGWSVTGNIGSSFIIGYGRLTGAFYLRGRLMFDGFQADPPANVQMEWSGNSYNAVFGHANHQAAVTVYGLAEAIHGIRIVQQAGGSLNNGTILVKKYPKTPITTLPVFP